MVRRMCRGLWPVGPSGRGPYRASAGGGVSIAYVDAGWGGICLVGEVGWLAFEVGRQVHEPQHFEWCRGLHGRGVWPVILGPPGWGRRSCRR